MKWNDTREIAQALSKKFPDIDPKVIRSVQIKPWVLELNQFTDEPETGGESILEEIQILWIEETSD
ncbi:FeS assembly protein IscX [Oxalobacteraceae bacterium GrIS 2.11]